MGVAATLPELSEWTLIGCFQLKNENPMCEDPSHQVNVSCIRVLCAPDSS